MTNKEFVKSIYPGSCCWHYNYGLNYHLYYILACDYTNMGSIALSYKNAKNAWKNAAINLKKEMLNKLEQS